MNLIFAKKINFFLMFLITAASLSLSHANASKTVFTNRTGINFVKIPSGSFIMGSPKNEPGRKWYEKQHKVVITKGFYMSETEITQGQYFKIMKHNPSYFNKCGALCPVETVSWYDCQEFIARLNLYEKTTKYRLPTEAEWEYACRAGSTTSIYNGNITATGCGEDKLLNMIAWYCGNSGLRKPVIYKIHPHQVRLKMPNNFGLYDMIGNVAEWCQDACKPRGTFATGVVNDTYDKEIIYDPVSAKGPNRIFRGGSWKSSTKYLRSATRSSYKPVAKRNGIGFRIVKEM